jgi:drug/metabolite transporter (DMT)-like permease
VAVAAFVAITRRPWTRPSTTLLWQMTLLALLANVIPFALISWAEEHIESGTASVLNATVPIFTAVVAAAVLDEEEFTRSRAAGLLLAFFGVAVLTGPDALDVTDSSVIGQIAVVAAALCYGVAAVMLRSMIKGHDLVNLTLLQLALAGLVSLPILFVVTGGPNYNLSLEAWLSMIDVLGSVRASLVTYIVPVVALFLGWIVLDESVGVNTIAGFLLIIGGVVTVMREKSAVRRRPVEAAPAAVGE